jgi:hypothetical protein
MAAPLTLFYWNILHYLLILVVLRTVNGGEIDNKTGRASDHDIRCVGTCNKL